MFSRNTVANTVSIETRNEPSERKTVLVFLERNVVDQVGHFSSQGVAGALWGSFFARRVLRVPDLCVLGSSVRARTSLRSGRPMLSTVKDAENTATVFECLQRAHFSYACLQTAGVGSAAKKCSAKNISFETRR